jgi:DNA-binding IclR family transcriptional regulator
MDTPEKASVVLTVARGMQVLRAFRADRASMGNTELVRRTGLSKATVSRLTSTLLHLGYLRRVPAGREFELSTGPLGIGHSFITSSELLQTAIPFMQGLADQLNVSVALAIPDGLDMLYIGYRASKKVALRLGVGSVLPMATTSIGRAFLWGLPVAEQKRYMSEFKRNATGKATLLEQGIRKSFAELELTGTCAVLGGFQRDAYGIALPVFVGRKRIVMGLSCGKADMQPDLAAEKKRISPVLKKAAARFEELLAEFDGQP